MGKFQLETRVLGGLPITVEFSMANADPDVGIMSEYVDEWYIIEVNGKKLKNTQWVEDRIHAKKGEEDRLVEEMTAHANDRWSAADEYDDYDPYY